MTTTTIEARAMTADGPVLPWAEVGIVTRALRELAAANRRRASGHAMTGERWKQGREELRAEARLAVSLAADLEVRCLGAARRCADCQLPVRLLATGWCHRTVQESMKCPGGRGPGEVRPAREGQR